MQKLRQVQKSQKKPRGAPKAKAPVLELEGSMQARQADDMNDTGSYEAANG